MSKEPRLGFKAITLEHFRHSRHFKHFNHLLKNKINKELATK